MVVGIIQITLYYENNAINIINDNTMYAIIQTEALVIALASFFLLVCGLFSSVLSNLKDTTASTNVTTVIAHKYKPKGIRCGAINSKAEEVLNKKTKTPAINALNPQNTNAVAIIVVIKHTNNEIYKSIFPISTARVDLNRILLGSIRFLSLLSIKVTS